MKISIGVLIAIALIIYWWMKDHPSQAPAKQGYLEIVQIRAA